MSVVSLRVLKTQEWITRYQVISGAEFLQWDYKIRPDSDHAAKFQGDRSRDIGERVAKKKHLG